MTALASMAALGVVCWVFRISLVTLVPAERLPTRLHTSLEHLAPAVLASIVAVDLVGMLRSAPPLSIATLAAASLATALVAYRTRSLSIVSALGLTVVLVLDLLLKH